MAVTWKKLAFDADLTTHTGNTTTAHGAVSAATASKHVVRDASARAKFAQATAAGDAIVADANVRAPDSTLLEGSSKATVQDHTPKAHTIASHSDTTGTGAELNTLTDGSETALHSHAGVGGYTEGARVYNDANISIPHETATALTFNSERWDTDTIHDTVTNNSRLTCKTAGKYLVVANVVFGVNAIGHRWLFLLHSVAGNIGMIRNFADATINPYMSVATIYHFEVNEYVECKVWQNSGGALNIVYDAKGSPEFMMQRIG